MEHKEYKKKKLKGMEQLFHVHHHMRTVNDPNYKPYQLTAFDHELIKYFGDTIDEIINAVQEFPDEEILDDGLYVQGFYDCSDKFLKNLDEIASNIT